ncbi:MAG: hypothetical protein H8E79_05375 [Desulfobulbaceae bacterium]|uniref:PSP1 C-terminal domain-containing protein n=1 Tax=Candidatus Desulfatifera sulfidica TaxID=2841691 RepID=A0A8J6N6H8_9BACT|nr:hypothetical protein [Candidatus Desulfatifera sulfidica]
MIKTDHGLEPAMVACSAPSCREAGGRPKPAEELIRRATSDETARFEALPVSENQAFELCVELILKHKLAMRLVRVERFFNGSKIIFYFTANNRVDFRDLVKDLVQQFHTRVEMRQVGVRHETKMVGGLGICGRELCCSSFIKKFDSVSIKMAKEQDLPLNPAKISGLCNRLLCCLTYEYETYKQERRAMPRAGRKIEVGGQTYQVLRQHPLQQSLLVRNSEGEQATLTADQWQGYEVVRVEKKMKKK